MGLLFRMNYHEFDNDAPGTSDAECFAFADLTDEEIQREALEEGA